MSGPDAEQAPEPVVVPEPAGAPPIQSASRAPTHAGQLGAAAAALSAGDGRLPSPGQVLALQRAAGNAATAQMLARSHLAREDKKLTPQADTTDVFGHKMDEPSKKGTTTAKQAKEDANAVDVTGPRLDASATAWVKDGKEIPGGGAYLGFVQNLVSSDRARVYRVGGKPDGDFVAEIHEDVKGKWDAYKDPNNPKQPQHQMKPFYGEPKPIGNSNTQDMPASAKMWDEPGFYAQKKHVDGDRQGFLTETKGQDVFKLALAVKRADNVVDYLQGFEWSVPWAMPIQGVSGTGKEIDLKSIPEKDLAADGPDPNLSQWSLHAEPHVWQTVATLQDAMALPPHVLLRLLPEARRQDQGAYKNIVGALDAKNPTLKVTLTCLDEADEIAGDYASASISGSQLGASKGGIHIAEDETATISATLADLFGSAGAIGDGATLKVHVFLGADMAEGSAAFPLPFAGAKRTIKAGGAEYEASVSF